MKQFVEGVDRGQSTLFPECLDDGGSGSEGVREKRFRLPTPDPATPRDRPLSVL